ncbi:MAG: DUF1553 domain-containing protein, partial [Planctomycetaceae bacterium]|nr:DUF1553 domain-containing protein [Planctomycetaceae bacterium]
AVYRRSLYVFWRRIIAPTMFFDVASRQSCSVRAVRTNTPLHALLTLNETTYVECSRVLAEQLLTDPQLTDDAARIRTACLRILSRPPLPNEVTVLQNGLRRSRREYSAEPTFAEQLLSVGDSPRNTSVDTTEHAAWTSACLILLNLDETLNHE